MVDSDTANAQHAMIASNTGLTITANTNYAVSAYLKAGEYTTAALLWMNAGFTSGINIHVNLQTGQVTGSGATGTGTLTSATATLLNNGWVRVVLIGIIDASSTAGKLAIYLNNGNTYVGVPGQGMYVWGAQVETGLWPTSVIPTTSATVTRSNDIISTPVAFGSAYSGYAAFIPQAAAADTIAQNILSFDDTTINNRFQVQRVNATAILNSVIVVTGTGGSAPSTALTLTAGTLAKAAWSVAAGAQAMSQNGVAANTSANATVPAITTVHFGCRADGANTTQLNGYLVRCAVWKGTALTNAQLQALSAN
jgi:hypothetical protein